MTTDSSAEPVRRHVIYTGHVQGVCFRADAAEIASRFPVVGYVRNLPNGTVELEIEGVESDVERVLAQIAQHFAANIRHIDKTTLPARGDETRFVIRY